MDSEEDVRWNMAAAGCDINMLGKTVSTHNDKDWVHADDYRRVKRKLKIMVDRKDRDDEAIKGLTVQVSGLK